MHIVYMSTFIDSLKKSLAPYYTYIIVLIVSIVFIIVSYLVIQKYKQKYIKNEGLMNDVANANTRKINEVATIMMFHVDWCPHCKTAKPDWDQFKSQYDGKVVNGFTIKCIDHNCTNDKDSKVQSLLNKYNIESYPTVKMLKREEVFDFDSKITKSSLSSFVNVMLQ